MIGITDGKSNYCSNLTADSQGEKQSGCNNKKSSTAVQMKRVFDESTVTKVTRWIRTLDRVVAAGRAGDPTFASQYNSFFTKLQKKAYCMTTVAQWAEHQLKDGEDLLELTIDGWICNMCQGHFSRQQRLDRVYKHILTREHMDKVKGRAALRGVQSVESAAASAAQLQLVPQMIRQGACVATAQASLPFTAGTLMLDGL